MHLATHHLSSCCLVLLLCAQLCAGVDLDSAKRAYHQGDYATAVKQFTALAETGNSEGQLILGKMYLIGQGVPKDPTLAMKWFQASAEQGDADAQFFLGAMYLIPDKDAAQGLQWIRRSAEQGNQDAQLLLGKAYLKNGKELPRDPVQADMWLRLAAKDNKKFYQNELHAAEQHMTADQITRGKALAAAWKPKQARGPEDKFTSDQKTDSKPIPSSR